MKSQESWTKWTTVCKISEKNLNIVNIDIREDDDGEFLVCATTTKSDLRLISCSKVENSEESSFKILETLDFGNNLLETCRFTSYKDANYLAVSSSDFKIHIYEVIGQKSASKFEYCNSLSGHSDKIGSVSTTTTSNSDGTQSSYIATASKDRYIRTWRFAEEVDAKILGSVMKRNIYRVGKHFIHLESTLLGHEDSVSSVSWAFRTTPEQRKDSDLIMISSSFDFTVQIWERELQSQVWMNTVRLGQMGGNKNTFYGARLSPNGLKLAAFNYNGCFYVWNRGESLRDWKPITTVSGHSGPVTDLDWSSEREFLVTTSHD